MTSNDNAQYVTVEVFNAATGKTNQHLVSIDNRLAEMDKTLTEIKYELRYQARDTEHLQTSIYWGFVILAIVVAIVGLAITRSPTNKQEKQDSAFTRSEIQEIVRSEMRATVDEAVSRALTAKK